MAARRPWRMVTLVPALVLAAGACGQDADQETSSQPGPATASFSTGTTRAATAVPVPAGPPTQAELDRVAVRLERLARLRNPVAMAVAGDDTTLYVGERAGLVRAIRTGRLEPWPLLDLTDQVVVEGEGGLLGIAVAPAGQHLYVSFTDRRHAVRLVEVTLHGDRVDPASRRDILTVQQPSTRHHGGNIGDLWIGDVGQYVMEEIDAVSLRRSAGAIFGWNRLEGRRRFNGSPPPRAASPVHQYNHNDGRCTVVGGYVYRGTQIRGLQGAYLYGDVCDGRVRALARAGGRSLRHRDLPLRLPGLVSLAEDRAGELYAFSLAGGIYRLAAVG